MKIFSTVWLVRKAPVILILMMIALCIALFFFWNGEKTDKITVLLAGVSTGLFLVIIQFIFSWDEYRERDRLRLLGLRKVLENKKDREYYGELIANAKRTIDLMGKTGNHFLEDFANEGGTDKEAKVLLEVLARGVKVRFLLSEATNGQRNEDTVRMITKLSEKYSDFSCRYFESPGCHSIFVADDDVIIGPYFPKTKSMNTPALHVRRGTVLSECYLRYFNSIWEQSKLKK